MLRSALLTPGAMRVMRTSGAFYIAFATRMSRIWSAHHEYNICVGCARDTAPAACDTRVGCALLTRLSRVCRPFMHCRCRALLARRKCAGPWVTFGQYCMYCTSLYDPGHWTFYFLWKGIWLSSVVVPLMQAVLPYARGRGFDSRSIYCVKQFVFLFVYSGRCYECKM
jgi:hypothetical protein